jgi:hypothetical protein
MIIIIGQSMGSLSIYNFFNWVVSSTRGLISKVGAKDLVVLADLTNWMTINSLLSSLLCFAPILKILHFEQNKTVHDSSTPA